MNVSTIRTIEDLIDEPASIVVSVLLFLILFLVTRWIFDRFNAGWSKRLISEFDLLDRLLKTNFHKSEEKEKAVKVLRGHICKTIIKKATLKDRMLVFLEVLKMR